MSFCCSNHCNCNNRNRRACACDCGCEREHDYFYASNFSQRGPAGPVGPAGPQGIPGGLISYGDFYATMPADNAAPIAAGGDVAFPSTSAISPTGITRAGTSAITLAEAGTYLVSFNATPTEASQLVLTLNGAELPNTVTGTTAAGSELKGTYLITTTIPNSTITLRNPANSATTVTLTPSAGGANPVTAHLVVARVA